MRTHEFLQRKVIRLRDYDYRTPGVYFVTVCTRDQRCLLANVHETYHELTDAGRFVMQTWHGLPVHFPRVLLDSFIIMPNHVHGIVMIQTFNQDDVLKPVSSHDTSLSTVMGFFKSDAARRINLDRKTPGAPVWQRGFYDRIITSEKALGNAREYIVNNPAQWLYDRENPDRVQR